MILTTHEQHVDVACRLKVTESGDLRPVLRDERGLALKSFRPGRGIDRDRRPGFDLSRAVVAARNPSNGVVEEFNDRVKIGGVVRADFGFGSYEGV